MSTPSSPVGVHYRAHVHHRDQQALVATSPVDGDLVGAARFTRDSLDREAALVEVSVVEEWQDRGIAIELLTRLMRCARGEGIRRFTDGATSLLHHDSGDAVSCDVAVLSDLRSVVRASP